MKEEGLKNYISNILQKDYRFQFDIIAHIRPNLIYFKTFYSDLEGNLQESGRLLGGCPNCVIEKVWE